MRLCDRCIEKIRKELSKEAKQAVKNISPLLKKRENLSGNELARAIGLNSRPEVKQMIEELKSNLLLDYYYQGRKRVYKLTKTGERLLKLQREETEEKESKEESKQSKEKEGMEKETKKERGKEKEVGKPKKESEKEAKRKLQKKASEKNNKNNNKKHKQKNSQKDLVWDIDF